MADIAEAVRKLTKACDEAFEANKSSCSNAVWDVIKAVHDPAQQYRQANQLVDWMTTNWSEVGLEDGYLAANQGAVVVGGKKKESGHGHVIVIYPGDKILNGGYQYYWETGKKIMTMARTARYPRSLSTSIATSPWPGAVSCGDKTVWDPWPKEFALVQFFTPKWPLEA